MRRYIFLVATGLIVFLAPCIVAAKSFYYNDVLSMSKDGLGLFNTQVDTGGSSPTNFGSDNEEYANDQEDFPLNEDSPYYLPETTGGQETPAPVPEPATMLLLGTGLIGIAGLRKRLKKD